MSSSSSANRLVATAALLVGAAAAVPALPSPAVAAAPRVEAMLVDREGRVTGPRTVRVTAARVRSEGRTCRLREGLPINVLAALRAPFRAEGSCGSLYVSQVRRQRERGTGGWVYKVGRRLPGRSASTPAGRLRTGQRVTWFWCSVAGRCERTLETAAVAEPGVVRVTVRGYDDRGRGVAVGGAQVTVAFAGTDERRSATTASDGTAAVPVEPGRPAVVRATRRGMIPAFPEEVVGR